MPHLRQFESPDEAWKAFEAIRIAVNHLRAAACDLKVGRAPKAREKAELALRSAQGAARHAERIYYARYYEARRSE